MQVFVFFLLMKRFRSFTWLNINLVLFKLLDQVFDSFSWPQEHLYCHHFILFGWQKVKRWQRTLFNSTCFLKSGFISIPVNSAPNPDNISGFTYISAAFSVTYIALKGGRGSQSATETGLIIRRPPRRTYSQCKSAALVSKTASSKHLSSCPWVLMDSVKAVSRLCVSLNFTNWQVLILYLTCFSYRWHGIRIKVDTSPCACSVYPRSAVETSYFYYYISNYCIFNEW